MSDAYGDPIPPGHGEHENVSDPVGEYAVALGERIADMNHAFVLDMCEIVDKIADAYADVGETSATAFDTIYARGGEDAAKKIASLFRETVVKLREGT